jgi:hypothetical protein
MVIGSGTAQCKGCGYEYSPEKGDPDFPVPKGVRFQVGTRDGLILMRTWFRGCDAYYIDVQVTAAAGRQLGHQQLTTCGTIALCMRWALTLNQQPVTPGSYEPCCVARS